MLYDIIHNVKIDYRKSFKRELIDNKDITCKTLIQILNVSNNQTIYELLLLQSIISY